MTPNSCPSLVPNSAEPERTGAAPGNPAGAGKLRRGAGEQHVDALPQQVPEGGAAGGRWCASAAGVRVFFLSLNTQGKPAPSISSSGSRAESSLWSRACGHHGGMGREGWETTPTCPEKSSYWVTKAGRKKPGLFGRFSIASRPRAAGSRSPGR